jgi:hypothetical protein
MKCTVPGGAGWCRVSGLSTSRACARNVSNVARWHDPASPTFCPVYQAAQLGRTVGRRGPEGGPPVGEVVAFRPRSGRPSFQPCACIPRRACAREAVHHAGALVRP